MAGREGVDPPEPHRVLQVQPDACPEVVDAAFGALRELILRSEAGDAPQRLAELMAAHRTLADPASRPGGIARVPERVEGDP